MNEEFNPLVSIVIPVYNGSNYMSEAIDSALAQTYQNIEVIVVNDGSTDSNATHDIALSYGDRIRYFKKENGGVSTALNLGIANMKGEHFSWLSHDDLYTPDKIEKNVAALKTEPTRIVYSDYDIIGEKGEHLGTISAMQLHRAADLEYGLFPIVCGIAHGCSLLIHRSHFERVGVFDESLRAVQDSVLWLKMFRGQRLVYISESLVKGRVHPKRISFTYDKMLPECEVLWIGMFKNLTHEDMCAIGWSERNFWIKQALFMKEATECVKSTEHAYERLKESTDALRGEMVSIIMPLYNGLDLLPFSIQSVRQQSYQNWELILINDRSTDDVSEIERLVAEDSRIRIINAAHEGVAKARNTGIEAACGKFIAFLDSDNTWNPLKLEKQLKFMLENGYCASYTNYYQVDTSGNIVQEVTFSAINDDMFRMLLHSCSIATSCVVVERDYWGNLRFPEDIDYGEDVCCWLELAWRGNWGLLTEPLTMYRFGELSAYRNIYERQLGYAEILRYVLKKREWATESFQVELGLLAKNLADLFPSQETTMVCTASTVSRRNIWVRLVRVIKQHGVVGLCRIFIMRLKRQLGSRRRVIRVRSFFKKALLAISPTYRKVEAIAVKQNWLVEQTMALSSSLMKQGILDEGRINVQHAPPTVNAMPLTPDPKNTTHWHYYYNLAEECGVQNFDDFIKPVLDRNTTISYENVLDFACGFGRIADCFKRLANNITLCDINKLAIEHCKERFKHESRERPDSCDFSYCVSDNSLTLPFGDETFSFIYSWDAMVHFKYKWMDYYLGEFYRIVRTGGYVFVHHSNFGNIDPGVDKSENWADHAHGRTNITAEDVARLAKMHGFTIIEQNIMDWGEKDLDCVTLLKRD